MENEQWEYKIGGSPRSIVPALVLLAVFGGVTLWLYLTGNSAYMITAALTAIPALLIPCIIYRSLFVKLLIGKVNFYCQTKPGNGEFYRYNEIAKAWISSKESGGQSYLNYRTVDGREYKILINSCYEADGADYMIERINEIHGFKYDTAASED